MGEKEEEFLQVSRLWRAVFPRPDADTILKNAGPRVAASACIRENAPKILMRLPFRKGDRGPAGNLLFRTA
jgi:hypothetical protein